MIRLKNWDCIKGKWVLFFLPRYTPFHNSFCRLRYSYYNEKTGLIEPDCSKWGEVWLMWFQIPLKRFKHE